VRQPGAEGCIGAPALAAAVEKQLRRRIFVPPTDAELSVEGTVSRGPGNKFHARFRVADRQGRVLGERDVEETATSCDRLDEKLAFVVSLLIDPDAASGAVPPPVEEPAPRPPPPPEPKTPPPRVEEPASRPPRSPPWFWFVGVDFGGAAGVVPDIGWSVAASALISPPKLPGLRLRATSFFPNSRRFEERASADVSLVTGELALCPLEVRQRPFGMSLCVGGLVGELSARGDGFADSRRTSMVFGAVALDVVGTLSLSRMFGITLTPSLIVPVSKGRLAYEDAEGARQSFFEVSAVGASIAVGFAVGSF
jgi:hypothetical protein